MRIQAGKTDGDRIVQPRSIHHVFLNDIGGRIMMCSPYWQPLLDCFDVQDNDVLTFRYNRRDHYFDIEIVAKMGHNKYWIYEPGNYISFK